MNKKVSVIVPVYNAEKHLKKSLDSIINQSYENLEIIIIDDGSSDKTKEIIKKYASNDKRIIPYYSEINQGVSKTRNIGLRIFTGDYVVFVDSDDLMTKDCIEVLVKTAMEYNADLVDSYHLLVYKKNNKKYYFTENKIPKKIEVLGSLKDNKDVLTKGTYITGKLIDKKLLRNLYFDDNLKRYEDLVFEHQLKLRLNNLVFLNRIIYFYVQNDKSLINTLGTKHISYLDASKEVINNYRNCNSDIRYKIESLLFTNAYLTGISKIIKNNLSIDENVDVLYDYINRFNDVYKTWKNNKYISKFIKKRVIKLQNNKEEIKNKIKKYSKIDFIKWYFKYLSIRYRYKIEKNVDF